MKILNLETLMAPKNQIGKNVNKKLLNLFNILILVNFKKDFKIMLKNYMNKKVKEFKRNIKI